MEEVDIVVADGHLSRFNINILPPDTSGVTQNHDHINQPLHSQVQFTKENDVYYLLEFEQRMLNEHFSRNME